MAEVLSPVQVENLIRDLADRISRNVRTVSNAEEAKLAAVRAYDLAVAKAYVSSSGPQSEKRHLAELKTVEERERAEIAAAAFAHAQREMKSLETQLSAAQTIAKSVMQMYGSASYQGVGR